MSFASVFKSLQELFPQVDRRMLKAVAIEHTEDVDAAVEFILNEVLPNIYIGTEAHTHHDLFGGIDDKHLSIRYPETSQDVGHVSYAPGEQQKLLSQQVTVEEDTADFSESTIAASGCALRARQPVDERSTFTVAEKAGSSNSHDGEYYDQLSMDNGELSSLSKHQKNVLIGTDQSSHAVASSMTHGDIVFFNSTNVPHSSIHDLNESVVYNNNSSVYCESIHCANPIEMAGVIVQVDTSRIPKETRTSEDAASKSEANYPADAQTSEDAASKSEANSPADNEKSVAKDLVEIISEKMNIDTNLADLEDESFSTTVVTQSGQTCRIDVLEDAISDAKNNKKTLFSSMESVIAMMREVEDLEKMAVHAKEEAFRGGLDILAKVEEIKKMLLHAKEANDMHAGEVYGEKAILATEARELQSRLLNLSHERDRSIAILNEMRESLEARMVAAEEVRKAAELDKLEKEGTARKALMEQELVMDQVVQESKRLQIEAEENSKLREFLMDRGHVVDMLQGEIAVICKDVKSLKESYDDRVPISKLLSSSQTSCILASSGSSSKSVASNLFPEIVESSQIPKEATTLQIDNLSEKSTSEDTQFSFKKPSIDNDWDLFEDNGELYDMVH